MPLEITLKKVAEKCYNRIIERNARKLERTHGEEGLTELEKIDIYQFFRDKAYEKYGGELFFEDFYDLFDQVYAKFEEYKAWESLVMF